MSCVLALLGALLTNAVWPWEAFLRQNYLGEDPSQETGYSPTYRHRFRTTWVGKTVMPLENGTGGLYYSKNGRRMVSVDGGEKPFRPVAADFHRALADVLECVPHLRQYRDDVFASEVVQINDGTVTSFFIYRYLTDKPGQALQLSSFVLRTAQGCTTPEIEPQQVDLDYGGPARQVWDLLSLRGELFVVVACHEYEALSVEVYRRDGSRLKKVFEFTFATLGG